MSKLGSLRKFCLAAAILSVVVFVVWAAGLFRGANNHAGDASQLWTCSMHSQIRPNHPGKCPICGMELEPVKPPSTKPAASGKTSQHVGAHLSLDDHARQMARVETVEIRPRTLSKEIIAAGKIGFDETTAAQITARIEGRIDEVQANFPGTPVKEQ